MPKFSEGPWVDWSCSTGAAIFDKIVDSTGLKLTPERVRLVAMADPIDLGLGMGANGDLVSCSESSNTPV